MRQGGVVLAAPCHCFGIGSYRSVGVYSWCLHPFARHDPRISVGVLFRVALLFSIFGALFGTILALDKSAVQLFSGLRCLDAPKTRVLICSGLGLLIVVVMRSWSSELFPFAWVAMGALVGGILGWFGWRWAQYADF